MPNPTLVIRSLSRFPSFGPEDQLAFSTGVNVLVGAPNTGKSKWLIMLDYLLGDDGNQEEKFEDLYTKYDSVRAVCTIGGKEFTIERHWKDVALKTKAVVNGEVLTIDALHQLFLTNLAITPFRFPQGNPYGPRKWPTMAWRGLVRHLYRRQKMWTDIADQQHETEQHASICQFLGIGHALFSAEYGELVEKENRIRALELERDQFLTTLNAVSREIVDVKELGVALTPQSIADAVGRLEAEIEAAGQKRVAVLEAAFADAARPASPTEPQKEAVGKLSEELAGLRERQAALQKAMIKAEERLREVDRQKTLLTEELGRLGRARVASRVLPKLKITHCPACDQAIEEPDVLPDDCFLCQRPRPLPSSGDDFDKRLEFERAQIDAEIQETQELHSGLVEEIVGLRKSSEAVAARIYRIESALRPVRQAVSAIIPSEVRLLDMEVGRLHERLSQLNRIKGVLAKQTSVSDQINKIQAEVATLERQVMENRTEVDFHEASQRLQNGINAYLNQVHEANPTSWTQSAEITVSIRDRDISIKVGKSNWKTKLGGTQSLIFLMAYHYSLMTLTKVEGCHFPGFTALDFQAKFEDGSEGITKEHENFVVVPFIKLLASEGMSDAQLIVAGSSFENLEGVNRVQLSRIWGDEPELEF